MVSGTVPTHCSLNLWKGTKIKLSPGKPRSISYAYWLFQADSGVRECSGDASTSQESLAPSGSAVNAMENHFTLSETPNQPRIVSFPSVTFGKSSVRRSFQSSWFVRWPWLYWNDSLGSVVCHVCLRASEAGLLHSD